jgi:hypothetical protein
MEFDCVPCAADAALEHGQDEYDPSSANQDYTNTVHATARFAAIDKVVLRSALQILLRTPLRVLISDIDTDWHPTHVYALVTKACPNALIYPCNSSGSSVTVEVATAVERRQLLHLNGRQLGRRCIHVKFM